MELLWFGLDGFKRFMADLAVEKKADPGAITPAAFPPQNTNPQTNSTENNTEPNNKTPNTPTPESSAQYSNSPVFIPAPIINYAEEQKAVEDINHSLDVLDYLSRQQNKLGMMDSLYGLQKILDLQTAAEEKYLEKKIAVLQKVASGKADKYELTRDDVTEYQDILQASVKQAEQLDGELVDKAKMAGIVVAATAVSGGALGFVAGTAAAGAAAASVTGGGMLLTAGAGLAAGTAAGTATAGVINVGERVINGELRQGNITSALTSAAKETAGDALFSAECSGAAVTGYGLGGVAARALPGALKATEESGYVIKTLGAIGAESIGAGITNLGNTSIDLGVRYAKALYDFSKEDHDPNLTPDQLALKKCEFLSQRGLTYGEATKALGLSAVNGIICGKFSKVGAGIRAGIANDSLKSLTLAGENIAAVGSATALTGAVNGMSADDLLMAAANTTAGYMVARRVGQQSAEYPEAARKLQNSKIRSPLELKDRNTGLPTRAVISDPDTLAQMCPTDSDLVFADFNNMGPPNTFGLRRPVDQLLNNIEPAVKASFPNPEGTHALRVGGDEIAILVPRDPNNPNATQQGVKAFVGNMAERRNALFSPGDPQVIQATEFAKARSVVRGIFTASKDKHGKDFSMERFYQDARAELRKTGVSEQEMQGLDLRGVLKRLGEHAQNQPGDQELMGLTYGIVRVGEDPSPETMYRALGQADYKMHRAKEKHLVDDSVSEISDSIVLRESEQLEIRRNQQGAQRYRAGRDGVGLENPFALPQESYQTMVRAGAADPSSSTNLRYGLIVDSPASDFIVPSATGKTKFVEADITAFGAINNQLGGARGDDVFKTVSGIIAKHLGANSTAVRYNGGSIIVAVDPTKAAQLERILPAMQEEMTSTVRAKISVQNGQLIDYRQGYVAGEHEVRQALAELRGNYNESQRELGTVRVRTTETTVDPNESVESLFDRVNIQFESS